MTNKILVSSVVAAALAGTVNAGTFNVNPNDLHVPSEVLFNQAMSDVEIDFITSINAITYTADLQGHAAADYGYTTALNLNIPAVPGFTQTDPAFNIVLTDGTNQQVANLNVAAAANPVICDINNNNVLAEYVPTNNGVIVFQNQNQAAVSDTQEYYFSRGGVCGGVGVNPLLAGDIWIDGIAPCTTQLTFTMLTYDSNNNELVDVAEAPMNIAHTPEFSLQLTGKTFADIGLFEKYDIRGSLAENLVDINNLQGAEQVQHDYEAPGARPLYYAYPHNMQTFTADTKNLMYNYYMDLMDFPQSADPISWWMVVNNTTPFTHRTQSNPVAAGADLGVSFTTYVQGNPQHFGGLIKEGPAGALANYDVFNWMSDSVTPAPVMPLLNQCDEEFEDFTCTTPAILFAPGVDTKEYFGVGFGGGLQASPNAIYPQEFMGMISVTGGLLGVNTMQVWPSATNYDVATCTVTYDMDNEVGYWQWNGDHVVVPGVSAGANNPAVIKIYNGNVQDHDDRWVEFTDSQVGYDNQSNISRNAEVIFRLTDDNGNKAMVTGYSIPADQAMAFKASDLLVDAQAINPTFGTIKPKFKAEIFVNNAPKNVHILAMQLNDKGDRTLPVYKTQAFNNNGIN